MTTAPYRTGTAMFSEGGAEPMLGNRFQPGRRYFWGWLVFGCIGLAAGGAIHAYTGEPTQLPRWAAASVGTIPAVFVYLLARAALLADQLQVRPWYRQLFVGFSVVLIGLAFVMMAGPLTSLGGGDLNSWSLPILIYLAIINGLFGLLAIASPAVAE
ncbi:hypothetical protein [Nocardia sp. NBC_01377]|uniref:hypothetical protein n=1 Tax=Nocardia sp. NBC_01377 TaxID=2903595 RepID=UPI00386BEBE7